MYERYYGLRERPFELTPNPRYLFLTEKHQEALTILRYGISTRKGVTLVFGQAGSGKTTLIRTTLASFANTNAWLISLNNPTLRRDEFVDILARGFHLSEAASRSKGTFLTELEARLIERRDAGLVTALIVDEAQALSDELLEEVRLLVNLETEEEKLLPVVLVGQAELAERLRQPSCAALKQRIVLRCQLDPLTLNQTAEYIATRIRIADGSPGKLFTRQAVDLIHERSRGVPRTISVLCDNALMTGFAVGQRPIGRDLVLEVCKDFDFEASPHAVAPRAAEKPPAATVSERVVGFEPGVIPAMGGVESPLVSERRPPALAVADSVDGAEPAAVVDAPLDDAEEPANGTEGLFGMFERGSRRSWFARRRGAHEPVN
jgi:general secretion pathway protein A